MALSDGLMPDLNQHRVPSVDDRTRPRSPRGGRTLSRAFPLARQQQRHHHHRRCEFAGLTHSRQCSIVQLLMPVALPCSALPPRTTNLTTQVKVRPYFQSSCPPWPRCAAERELTVASHNTCTSAPSLPHMVFAIGPRSLTRRPF